MACMGLEGSSSKAVDLLIGRKGPETLHKETVWYEVFVV